MGFSDDVRAEVRFGGNGPTRLDAVRAAFSDDDMADLAEVLADPLVSAAAIARAFAKRGIKVDAKTVHNWRERVRAGEPL
jgi:hypothetical protein